MTLSSSEELAWAAGLFEGEGCFTTTGDPSRHGRMSGRAVLGMTDHDVVRRFKGVMGFGRLYVNKRANGNDLLMWNAGTRETFLKTVEMLGPWLSERRTNRAAEIMATWELPATESHERRPRSYVTDAVVAAIRSEATPARALSRRYGLHVSTVRRIRNGATHAAE